MGLWAPWWGLSSAVVSVMARTNTAYCVQGLSGARVTPGSWLRLRGSSTSSRFQLWVPQASGPVCSVAFWNGLNTHHGRWGRLGPAPCLAAPSSPSRPDGVTLRPARRRHRKRVRDPLWPDAPPERFCSELELSQGPGAGLGGGATPATPPGGGGRGAAWFSAL